MSNINFKIEKDLIEKFKLAIATEVEYTNITTNMSRVMRALMVDYINKINKRY